MAESWLDIPAGSGFSLDNIPFGIISHAGSPEPHAAVAIGDHVLDLKLFAAGDGFSGLPEATPSVLQTFSEKTLNGFAALGRPLHQKVRAYLRLVFAQRGDNNNNNNTPFSQLLRDNATLRGDSLVPQSRVETHLPLQVGDYTDFYVGRNHAYNVGVLFRGPDNALQPNYAHLPVGYHGRASSVVVSGTPVRRPWGQMLEDDAGQATTTAMPVHRPSRRLDMELELGAFVCRANALGAPVPVAAAEDHLFGYVLLNDWSARDVQAWEYVPLGPFNAKNFATTISAWVVLADALEPFRTEGIRNDLDVLPYLRSPTARSVFDIHLEVSLKSTCVRVLFSCPCQPETPFINPPPPLSSRESRRAVGHHPLQRQVSALVLSADARPPHRRRLSSQPRRPPRLRHHQRARPRDPGQPPRNHQRRHQAHRPLRRRDPHVPG